jgi:hypothetical protein
MLDNLRHEFVRVMSGIADSVASLSARVETSSKLRIVGGRTTDLTLASQVYTIISFGILHNATNVDYSAEESNTDIFLPYGKYHIQAQWNYRHYGDREGGVALFLNGVILTHNSGDSYTQTQLNYYYEGTGTISFRAYTNHSIDSGLLTVSLVSTYHETQTLPYSFQFSVIDHLNTL